MDLTMQFDELKTKSPTSSEISILISHSERIKRTSKDIEVEGK